jgi:hypothetical protein
MPKNFNIMNFSLTGWPKMLIYQWTAEEGETRQSTRASVHNPRPGFIALSFEGSDPVVGGYEAGLATVVTGLFDQVFSLLIDDLTLAQLKQAVDVLDVDTAAQTAAGLRRAIERHLEEGGQ